MTTAIAIISAIIGAAPELEALGKSLIDDITGGVITPAQGIQKMADGMVALANQQGASDAKDAKSDVDEIDAFKQIEATKPDNATAMAETPKVTPAEFAQELKDAAAELVGKDPEKS